MSPGMPGAARDPESVRKLVHLGMLVLPVWMGLAPDPWRLRGLLLAFSTAMAVDVLRLVWTPFGRVFLTYVGAYLRPAERRGLTRVHGLTGAALLLAWTAPGTPAIAALSYAVVGDAAAALVGRRWGRPLRTGKSLAGSLACFLACLLVGMVLLAPRGTGVVVVGALVATLVEALPARVPDNVTVPLATALVLHTLT